MSDIPAIPITGETTDATLLETAGKPDANAEGSLLDQAGAEAKVAQEAESKRLLDAEDKDLSAEDKVKKAEIIKVQEAAKVKTDADAKAKLPPEKYEFKIPEGITLDQAAVDKITPVFKELGLNQAAAQRLIDVYIEQQKSQADTQAKSFSDFNEESKKETIKALGANYKEELAFAAKSRDALFSPETLELINAAGLGNNKAMILDMIKIGRMISEDKLVEGKRTIPSAALDPATVMYG